MEQTPKISIIVPVYNTAPYLHQCLNSLIQQTYPSIEILCIDDGSSDGSEEMLDQYAAENRQLKVLHMQNAGVSAARNAALDSASGQYVIFVDSDDWIEENTCEAAISLVHRYPGSLVLWSYVREYDNRSVPKIIFPEERIFDKAACRSLHRRMAGLIGKELNHPENADALSTVWGKLYQRDIIAKNHIRFTDLQRIGSCEDGLFNLQYFAHVERAVYIPDCLTHYRKNTGMTSAYRSSLAAQWKNLFGDMRNYLNVNSLGAEFQQALNNRISLSIIGLGLNALVLPSSEALAEIRGVLTDPEYRAAIKTLPLRYFPLHWWVFFACCKLEFTLGVFLLLKCIERIKG